MINDIIIKCLGVLIDFYSQYIHPHVSDLLTLMVKWRDYSSQFQVWLGGVYYILGKPLVIFIVTAFGIILVIRLIMALVNIIGQYVP